MLWRDGRVDAVSTPNAMQRNVLEEFLAGGLAWSLIQHGVDSSGAVEVALFFWLVLIESPQTLSQAPANHRRVI